MKKQPIINEQGLLFEESYLLRIHRQLTTNPEMALTELVANAWDAGASRVEINIEEKSDKTKWITIQDNGVGMTIQQFQKYWKTLAYDRIKHQGDKVIFPDKKESRRRAFGRNGIGRHGLFCFGDSYVVTSNSYENNEIFSCKVTISDGKTPIIFEEIEKPYATPSHGTLLTVQVERNQIRAKTILQSLSRRFLFDPQFTISVNGDSVSLENLTNLICTETFQVDNISLEMNILHANDMELAGIAFWQGGRLVGQPSWILGNETIADKRTKNGKEYSVIIKTNDLADYIRDDWSGFQNEKKNELQPIFDAVTEHFVAYCKRTNSENFNSTRQEFEEEFFDDLKDSSSLVKLEFEEALKEVLETYPNASKATIKTVLDIVIQLGKKRGGSELLQKLINMDGNNLENLNTLLSEWTVQEIFVVLDEIDRRIRTIEAIKKLSQDKETPELAVLHPLITEARWVFGPEFDSSEYTSNQWLVTTAKKLFKIDNAKALQNPNKRPDL
ncbi:MAG: ATP-binding protein, partial [Planctomycetaceae bacterium]|nr:ATP-binding protein [Planctomycetaceae bacterium]